MTSSTIWTTTMTMTLSTLIMIQWNTVAPTSIQVGEGIFSDAPSQTPSLRTSSEPSPMPSLRPSSKPTTMPSKKSSEAPSQMASLLSSSPSTTSPSGTSSVAPSTAMPSSKETALLLSPQPTESVSVVETQETDDTTISVLELDLAFTAAATPSSMNNFFSYVNVVTAVVGLILVMLL
mmetsp:Transcript_12240/g.13851  ORF Transcript_12240/g.13851 Transcript_12240/m.13851 type:complete len:178 (-) Transcript_12240:30-563(-)